MLKKLGKWSALCICLGLMFLGSYVTEAAETKSPALAIEAYGDKKATTIYWGVEHKYSGSDGSYTDLEEPDTSGYPEGATVGYDIEIASKSDFSNAKKVSEEADMPRHAKIKKAQFGTEGGRLYARVRSTITLEDGKVTYGKWSKAKELVFVKITKKNFPGMYQTLKKDGEEYYTFSDADAKKLENGTPISQLKLIKKYRYYDKNKDGWLDQSEINDLRTLRPTKTKVSGVKGIAYLTNLNSIHLESYSGTKLDLSKNKVDKVWVQGITSKKITVIAPDAQEVHVEARQEKLTEIDVSACVNVKDLNVGNWKTVVKTLKMPKKSKKLTMLSIRGYCGSSLNVNAYTNLGELSILQCDVSKVKLDQCKKLKYLYFYWCNKLKNPDLTKNTKLKYVDFYGCRQISLNAVKRAKTTKATTGKGCYWMNTKTYQNDYKKYLA